MTDKKPKLIGSLFLEAKIYTVPDDKDLAVVQLVFERKRLLAELKKIAGKK